MNINYSFDNVGGGTRRSLRGILSLLAVVATGLAIAQPIRASVDAVLVSFPDVQPLMMNNRVMVPVRGVFEHMGAEVSWDEGTQVVNATHNDHVIRLPLNSRWANVNGREVSLDSPAVMHQGRTVVPLRFLSESIGADVRWVALTRTVEITTQAGTVGQPILNQPRVRMEAGTVVPFRLVTALSSNRSQQGDRFTATLDTNNTANYQGLIRGSVLEGRVDVARAKDGNTPGVLGLVFDRIRTPDGRTHPINGTLIGLDSDSVRHENGRMVAKPGRPNDNLKFIGYGAGAGTLVALVTDGNMLTNALIGGALGFIFGEIQKDPSRARDVSAQPGMQFGVRLTNEFSMPVAAPAVN